MQTQNRSQNQDSILTNIHIYIAAEAFSLNYYTYAHAYIFVIIHSRSHATTKVERIKHNGDAG